MAGDESGDARRSLSKAHQFAGGSLAGKESSPQTSTMSGAAGSRGSGAGLSEGR